MRIPCTSCGADIAAADINLDRMLAKCARCNAVFDISAQVGTTPAGAARPLARRRPTVPMPPNIRVLEDSGQPVDKGLGESYRLLARPGGPRVAIERSWYSAQAFFLVFFALMWNGFLFFWYKTAFSGNAPAVVFVFPLIHVAVGVAVAYGALTAFINRTRITVVDGMLTIRHGPLPAFGNRVLATDDVSQLYCQLVVGSKGSRTYNLNAVMKTGAEVKLLRNLPDAEQALYIEQILETRLGIIDVAVGGEYQVGLT